MDNPALQSIREALLLIIHDGKAMGVQLHPKLFGVTAVRSMIPSFCCQAHAIDSYNAAMASLINDGLVECDGIVSLTPLGEQEAAKLVRDYGDDAFDPKLLN